MHANNIVGYIPRSPCPSPCRRPVLVPPTFPLSLFQFPSVGFVAYLLPIPSEIGGFVVRSAFGFNLMLLIFRKLGSSKLQHQDRVAPLGGMRGMGEVMSCALLFTVHGHHRDAGVGVGSAVRRRVARRRPARATGYSEPAVVTECPRSSDWMISSE